MTSQKRPFLHVDITRSPLNRFVLSHLYHNLSLNQRFTSCISDRVLIQQDSDGTETQTPQRASRLSTASRCPSKARHGVFTAPGHTLYTVRLSGGRIRPISHGAGATSGGGWAAAAWLDDGLVPHSPWTTSFNGIYGHGGGALFWPGYHIEGDPLLNVDGPLSSLRLKLAREAVEDVDYLTMLAAATSDAYARDLAGSVITGDLFHTDVSPDVFYALRYWIGNILSGETVVTLTTLSGTVTDAASGVPVADALVRAANTATRTAADGTYTLTLTGGEPLINIYHGRYLTQTLPFTGPTLDVALISLPMEGVSLFSFETDAEVDQWEFSGTVSVTRVTQYATDSIYALKVTFDDNPVEEPEMGTGDLVLSDWQGYTALEFDVFNESNYYTVIGPGIADDKDGWYPQTGGDITLLPNSETHVAIPVASIARDVDIGAVTWLSLAPETYTEQEDYRGETHRWPLGRRTLYVDNVRLARITYPSPTNTPTPTVTLTATPTGIPPLTGTPASTPTATSVVIRVYLPMIIV